MPNPDQRNPNEIIAESLLRIDENTVGFRQAMDRIAESLLGIEGRLARIEVKVDAIITCIHIVSDAFIAAREERHAATQGNIEENDLFERQD